jgi:hypothetical protein
LNIGSRTDSRDTFCYENHPWFSPFGPAFGCSNSLLANLCVAKRKYPKKRRPGRRLFPSLLAFDGGCQKGHPWPSVNAMHPCIAPNGLIPPKAPVLGAAYGRKPSRNLKTNQANDFKFGKKKPEFEEKLKTIKTLCVYLTKC